jgi:hypothetical protein
MKRRILILALTIFGVSTLQAQYSTYYNVDVNQNINSNINQNVNVTGSVYEYKTIKTIDYGALQLANAQKEANRLENIKYVDEQQKRISLEIASNPVMAYDYGYQNTFTIKGKDAKPMGFRNFTMSYRVPNKALFVQAGAGRFENVSSDGITTEIIFSPPSYNVNNIQVDIEKNAKMDSLSIGQLNKIGPNGEEYFVHKKDLNRATVYGIKGFKATLVWEDDYQLTITDNFNSFDSSKGDGVMYFVKVRTYGNKKEVTFEQLEGRRYYLRQLIEKIISTSTVFDMKY